MSDKFYRIITRDNRRNVMALAWEASGTLLASQESIVVEVRGKKRSDEQNAKLHAMLTSPEKRCWPRPASPEKSTASRRRPR